MLGVIISAIGVWLVARDVDRDQLAHAIRTADYGWVIAGMLAIIMTFFTRTWRWAVLLRPIALPASTIMIALLAGQVLNFVLPFRAGDIVRSATLARAPQNSFERTLGSIAIEKAWDWITLTIIVLIVTLIMPLPDWLIAPARMVGFIAALVLIGFGVIAFSPSSAVACGSRLIDRPVGWLPESWRRFVLDRLHRLTDSLIALRRRESIGLTALWSILTWALGIAANYAVMRAFGVDAWRAAMLLMAMLMIGVTLPPSIAAIGLFEGLTILTLSVFGVPYNTALAIGVMLHLVIFVPPVVTAGLWVVANSRIDAMTSP
jgi:uncharacterized protein (TIRG00374 family)